MATNLTYTDLGVTYEVMFVDTCLTRRVSTGQCRTLYFFERREPPPSE